MRQDNGNGKLPFEKPQIATVPVTRVVEQLGVAVASYQTPGGGGITP